MKKTAKMILVLFLTAVLGFSAVTAAADSDYVIIKTEGLDLMYQQLGLRGMAATEADRAKTALMGMLDLLSYDSNASILDNYIFVGLDKEDPDRLLYVAFGGKSESSMILYSPQNQYQHAVLIPIPMSAVWVETFMGPFCGTQYWQVNPNTIKNLLN